MRLERITGYAQGRLALKKGTPRPSMGYPFEVAPPLIGQKSVKSALLEEPASMILCVGNPKQDKD